jgi:hypothetical protein
MGRASHVAGRFETRFAMPEHFLLDHFAAGRIETLRNSTLSDPQL